MEWKNTVNCKVVQTNSNCCSLSLKTDVSDMLICKIWLKIDFKCPFYHNNEENSITSKNETRGDEAPKWFVGPKVVNWYVSFLEA